MLLANGKEACILPRDITEYQPKFTMWEDSILGHQLLIQPKCVPIKDSKSENTTYLTKN